MPAVATVLPLRSGDAFDPGLAEPDQRGQGPVDERRDRDHVEALFVGQRDLGLVGDRQVRLAGGDLLDRRRGVGGGVDADVEAGFLEVAELLRHVDPGVVGVGVEVERQAERLRFGAARPRTSRRRRRGRARARAGRRRAAIAGIRGDFIPCVLSPSDDAPLGEGEQADQDQRHRREDGDRGEQPRDFQLGVVGEDQVAEAGAGADPLAEDGADRGEDDGDLGAGEEARAARSAPRPGGRSASARRRGCASA